MSTRNAGRGTPSRRSSRILERSETPEVRNAFMATTPSRRGTSPDIIEQLTPTSAALRTRRAVTGNNGSNSISIKQEDASTSYYVREPSNRLTSPPVYRPALLRGDQRSFNDPRDASTSHSVSMSIFSSEGDLTDGYLQEEREVAQMQGAEEQQRPTSRVAVTRRASGQRRARTSADNLAYRPASDDEDDDDDGGSPTRRTRKGRNSNSFGAIDQGRLDNLRWKYGGTKTKKGRRKKTINGVAGAEDGDDSRDTNGDEDAGAASGKETRFDGASDSDDGEEEEAEEEEEEDNVARDSIHAAGTSKQPVAPKEAVSKSSFHRLFSAAVSYTSRFLLAALTHLLKLPGLAWSKYNTLGSGLRLGIAGLAMAVAAYYLAPMLSGVSGGGLSARHPLLFDDDDVPSSSSSSRSLALSLDRENQRLRAELNRLTARFDTLSSSIDAQISASLSSAAAKIQSDADARHSSEINRLTASTKRTVSRLAQDELKSIQDSVSSSVELMLRDLDNKINSQLKQRADDTEGKFFDKLESEVARIARYANDEVNARLGQAFDQTFLSSLIDDKLEKYSRDRTGEIDWASVTSGAWISYEGTVHRGYRLNSVWNLGQFLAQGRKVAIGDPVKAITPGAALGVDNCWMTGWDSFLQVHLNEPKVVEGLVVEHPLPGMIRTAPRRIIVWGIVDDSDAQFYLQYRRSRADSQAEYLRTLLPEPYLGAVPPEYQDEGKAPLVLAVAEFKTDGSTLQHLELTPEAQVYPFGVKAVRWQFVDGWNRAPPICVHRVRVHGSQWPVFGDQQP